MHGIFRQIFARKYLHQISKIHHGYLMCHRLNQRNIMADKTKRNILFFLKLNDQFDHRLLNRYVQR